MAKLNVALFLKKVKACERTARGCWLWPSVRPDGYGKYGGGNSGYQLAHRISYTVFVGPIPNGLCILHDCPGGDNPACINPAHLRIGTHADNMRDKATKGQCTPLRGESNGHAKLTEGQVREIFLRYHAGSVSQNQLSAEFNIAQSHVFRIVSGQVWRHVTEPLRRKVPSP